MCLVVVVVAVVVVVVVVSCHVVVVWHVVLVSWKHTVGRRWLSTVMVDVEVWFVAGVC